MAAVANLLTRPFRKTNFRPAVVTEAYDINRQFRLIGLVGETLREEIWNRGQKIQFQVRDMVIRTHMPMVWDAYLGFAGFIFFLHGNGPGSAWAASLRKGDTCRLSALKPCLDFGAIKGHTIFFGDETSIGAAVALGASAYAEHEHRYIFEVSSRKCSEQVVRHMGLFNTSVIQKTSGNSHAAEVVRTLLDTARGPGLPKWIFTGCAQSVQRIKNHFRFHGISLPETIVKPYWAEGKAGLG